jgi:hypothetical protein
MNSQNQEKEVWIGLARVKQPDRNGVLGDADQAYTNVLALAKNRFDFRSQVKQAIEELELKLLKLEESEPLRLHLLQTTPHKDILALANNVKRDETVAFDAFHSFDYKPS